MNIRALLSLPSALLLSSSLYLSGQVNPENAPLLFWEDSLPRVDILIDADSLQILQEDINSSHEFVATFIFNNYNGVHDTIPNIGFKLRGNGSRQSDRKSYRASFNTYAKGRKFLGYEKMNLKATQDASYIRPKTCWYIFRKMGIPAAWVSHVQLYVNGNFWGIYSNVEHVDELFIKRNFDNNSGNLYKCRYPSALNYINNNPDDYKIEQEYYGNRLIRIYELKINEEEDNYTDLMELTDVLNNSAMSDLSRAIKHKININQLMKFFALEVYLGHWDSYSGNGNNYYLYHNPSTNKFEYIPTDMDFTLGIVFNLEFNAELNIYNWFGNKATYNGRERRPPLRHRLLAIDEFRSNYTFYLKQLLHTCPPDSIRLVAEKIQTHIYPYVQQDPTNYYSRDEFFRMLDEGIGANYGIVQFLTRQHDSILNQLEDLNTPPIISDVKYPRYQNGNNFTISFTTEDETSLQNLMLYYRLNNASFDSIEITNTTDGRLWGAYNNQLSLNIEQPNSNIEFYIKATDAQQQTSLSPHEGYYSAYVNVSGKKLIISECMAANNNSITDEFGERDDWVEIYNADSLAIPLANKYLSDNYQNNNKWQLPDITLQPGEYAWFWADKDEEQGNYHANFKLSGDGETIYLFEKYDGEIVALLDSLNYPPLNSNTTYGRISDEDAQTSELRTLTPGYPNDTQGLAFAVFELDMSASIYNRNFSAESDVLDVTGNFNNWAGSPVFHDPNADETYTYTQYNLSANQGIDYLFRMNKDNTQIETMGDNRFYLLNEGCNNIQHVFNNEEINTIQPAESMAELQIYPNPVNNEFYINSEELISTLQLIDIYGRIVYSQTSIEPGTSMYIGELPQGIYQARIKTSDNTIIHRTLIKH